MTRHVELILEFEFILWFHFVYRFQLGLPYLKNFLFGGKMGLSLENILRIFDFFWIGFVCHYNTNSHKYMYIGCIVEFNILFQGLKSSSINIIIK